MDSTHYLLYLGVRHALGHWKNRTIKRSFMRWLADNGWPKYCELCGGKVTHKQRSVDHIIPVSVCLELEMPMLLFDSRNFRFAHRTCNSKRANRTNDLPLTIQSKLDEIRKTLYV